MDLNYLKETPNWIKAIKLIDREDNISDMDSKDKEFFKLYCLESLDLISAIGHAAPPVAEKIKDTCSRFLET